MKTFRSVLRIVYCLGSLLSLAASAAPDRTGWVALSGERMQWHNITLTLTGPQASETDTQPNPFTDYRMTVTFTHESGQPQYAVPGYFAADGLAAQSSATAGNQWRAHLAPDKPGRWTYQISFRQGKEAAVGHDPGVPLAPFDGLKGEFAVSRTDKKGRDFRSRGRLIYNYGRYLRFAGNGDAFLKAGPDAPESLLACADFDGTFAHQAAGSPGRPGEAMPAGLKTWAPHLRDWRPGDPDWQGVRGRGLIGALNYLATKGLNAFSFLTYNAGGDGDNVWPFVTREDKLHYDCSKLDQWGIVFDHATTLGLFLHFKLQETEIDDQRHSVGRQTRDIPESLDGGATGLERKLYLRELVARFGHALALNWNLGEENSQTTEEQVAMAQYLHDIDPYDHPIVLHTFPQEQDRVYTPLLGHRLLTGVSLQNHWRATHQRTLHWVQASAATGRPWVVCNDEQGPAELGVPPDGGYEGFVGLAQEKEGQIYSLHDIRKYTLWGNLLAGGAGVEYYFGYSLPQNDLGCEDWRSRDESWDYCRIALQFFHDYEIPFWDMTNADELVGNPEHDNGRYCFAQAGELYLVYLPEGGPVDLDLSQTKGSFRVYWFNPRTGAPLERDKETKKAEGGTIVTLQSPAGETEEDWLAVISRKRR